MLFQNCMEHFSKLCGKFFKIFSYSTFFKIVYKIFKNFMENFSIFFKIVWTIFSIVWKSRIYF
jgi:hypothetical protein